MAEDPQDLYVGDEEGGCHHYRDPATCEDCKQEEAEARYLVTVVDRLGDQVADAVASIAKAAKTLAELMADLYDIELVESSDGDDLKADLADAARSLRRARRIVQARKRLLAEVPGGQ
jgi:hypothetical protein